MVIFGVGGKCEIWRVVKRDFNILFCIMYCLIRVKKSMICVIFKGEKRLLIIIYIIYGVFIVY